MKRILASIVSSVVLTLTVSALAQAQSLPGTVPLYRYYNGHPSTYDHYFTITDKGPVIPGGAGSSWIKEGVEGQIYPSAETGTTPLYQYWNPVLGDHFYTINVNELGPNGKDGYSFVKIEGYVYATPATGTVPLYRYYNYESADHFYTIDFDELGDGSFDGPSHWIFERVECWVSP